MIITQIDDWNTTAMTWVLKPQENSHHDVGWRLVSFWIGNPEKKKNLQNCHDCILGGVDPSYDQSWNSKWHKFPPPGPSTWSKRGKVDEGVTWRCWKKILPNISGVFSVSFCLKGSKFRIISFPKKQHRSILKWNLPKVVLSRKPQQRITNPTNVYTVYLMFMNALIKNEGLVWDSLPRKPPEMVAIFCFAGGKELLFFSSNPTRKRTLWKLERKRLWRKTHYQNSDEFGWILLHLGLSTFNCQGGSFDNWVARAEAPQEHIRWFRSQHKEACECPGEKRATSRWLGHGLVTSMD